MYEENKRKGIILAGGNGTRLAPITQGISKQLMPVYDKPMIYYPLTTLMMAGIRDIMIITKRQDKNCFVRLFGDGSQLGISINYGIQESPEGIAHAFIVAKDYIQDSPVVLALGDNIFHGSNLINSLKKANNDYDSATIFAYPVKDPERYGVVEFDSKFRVLNIEEKPKNPKTSYAVTGLYFYDNSVIEKVKNLIPSSRGELEITSINQLFLEEKKLKIEVLGRGSAWLDTGTFESLHEASAYIKTLEQRQGLKIGCPEEISWRQRWITTKQLMKLSKSLDKSEYGTYLEQLIQTTHASNQYFLGNIPDNL